MTDQFITVNGHRLRYWDSGGTGPALLMTHGIGESLEFWHLQFEALGQQAGLLAWDLPGHGLSDEMSPAMPLEEQAAVAWKLLDELGVKQVHLVGNSLGAAISLRMAAHSPTRVRSMLLANSAALGRKVFSAFKVMTVPVLGEVMNRPSPAAPKRQIQAIVHRPESITPLVRNAIQRNLDRHGAGAHFLALLRSLTTLGGQRPQVIKRSHQMLRSLRMPVCIVHGDQDVVLPVEHSRQAHAMVPQSDLHVLAPCGHTPQLEMPEAFNRLVQRQLERVP
jgi:pimeloyl-ACP methyl ester carboxylesterase